MINHIAENNNMIEIAWITSQGFIDTDLPIIKGFVNAGHIKIKWYLLFSKRGLKKYNIREIRKCINNIDLKPFFPT